MRICRKTHTLDRLKTGQHGILGIEYMDRRNSLIEAVSLEDVNRTAKNLLQADKLTVVVVGAPKGVKSSE